MKQIIANIFKHKISYSIIGNGFLLILFYSLSDFNKEEILITKNRIIEVYDDSHNGLGNSKSALNIEKDQVCYSYTLGNKIQYPFVGIKISNKTLYDFRDKNFININIHVNEKKIIHVYYGTNYLPNNPRVFSTSLECVPNKNTYQLAINTFTTPSWWFKNNKVTESSLPKPDLSNIHFIDIQNDILIEKGTQDKICISSITLSKDNNWLIIIILLIIIFYNAFLFIGQKLFIKRKILVEFKSIEFENIEENDYSTEDVNNIINFISTHYENPELALKMIRKSLKITENRISLLLKNEFQLTYVDYLHQIRITEAKRLFQTSNLNINEVASLVGFGNISTFNRVFKDLESKTPGMYIKELKD